MGQGSSLIAAQDALIAVLQANPDLGSGRVSYEEPETPSDLRASDGSYESIFLGDAEADLVIPVLTGGTLYYDEALDLHLMLQVLKPAKSGTQRAANLRAVELLTEVIVTLANTPDLNSPDVRTAVVTGWEHARGRLPKGNGHGAGFDITIRVESRLAP